MSNQFFKQSKPKLKIGLVRGMIQRAQVYYALLNIFLLLITTYTVREATIRNLIPGFQFWWLLVAVPIIGAIVLIIDYKYIYPSEIAWHQHEAWKHRSPARRDFTEIKNILHGEDGKSGMVEALAKIEARLDAIEKK